MWRLLPTVCVRGITLTFSLVCFIPVLAKVSVHSDRAARLQLLLLAGLHQKYAKSSAERAVTPENNEPVTVLIF